MNGVDLLQEVKRRRPDLPVILVTGFGSIETAVEAMKLGAVDYLAKPFTVEELISIVQRGLNYGKIMEASSNMSINMMHFIPCPAKYYRFGYSTWANIEADGSLKIGVTDLFLRTINKIARIELFNPEQEIVQGDIYAHIETNDQLIHSILSPITGKIIKQNQSILSDFNLLEKDPYFKGWMYTIIPSDLEYELNHLTPCSSDRL